MRIAAQTKEQTKRYLPQGSFSCRLAAIHLPVEHRHPVVGFRDNYRKLSLYLLRGWTYNSRCEILSGGRRLTMKYDLGRALVERTVSMALEDMLSDSRRTVRRLVDLGLTLCRGPFEQMFFAACKATLSDSDSAYYGALEQAVRELNRKTLLTMGVNVGFEGCSRGSRKIREKEKALGCNIPWAISLAAGDGALSRSRVQSLVSQAGELGIHVFVLEDFHLPQQELEGLLADNPTCAFFLLTRAGRRWEPESLGQCHNVVLLFTRGDAPLEGQTAGLRQAGMPCGLCLDYTHPEELDALLAEAESAAPVLVVLRGENASGEARQAVYRRVLEIRTAGTHPFLVLEMESDLMAIDTVISAGSCRLSFDPQGRALLRGQVTNLRLEDATLVEILQQTHSGS